MSDSPNPEILLGGGTPGAPRKESERGTVPQELSSPKEAETDGGVSFCCCCLFAAVKATSPLAPEADALAAAAFCAKVDAELDGAQVASRLLAYRIHSPQEREALHALAVSRVFFLRSATTTSLVNVEIK